MLDVEDARVNAVLQSHITMPSNRWRQRETQDLILTASEAIQYRIAHDIADFGVPAGNQLFNL